MHIHLYYLKNPVEINTHINHGNNHKVKYIINACIPKLLLKNFFSSQNIRMSTSSINFNNEKIQKNDFYKNKKIFNIDNIEWIKY